MSGLTTLVALPSSIYAGDTLLFAIAKGQYPPPDWSLEYAFRSPINEGDATGGQVGGTAIEFVSTASGSNHLVSLAPDVSAAWLPQFYEGFCRAVNSVTLQKVTVWTGRLEVLPDLGEQPDNFDPRSHAQICLDRIEAVLENRASRDVLNSTIAGQTIGRMTPEQLLLLRNYYKAEVAAELEAELAANGEGTGKNVLVRFNRP